MPALIHTEPSRISSWLQAASRAGSTLSDERASLSYTEAARAIAELQARLVAAGVTREDCITAELANDLDGALLLLALLDAGLSFAPAPPRGTEARSTAHDIGLPTFSRWRVHFEPAPGDARGRLIVRADPLYRQGPAALATGEESAPRSYWNTSGSLGTPKLVVKRHDHVVANGAAAGEAFGLLPADRIALPIPIFHRFGSGMLIAGLSAGASIDLQQRSNLLRFLEREEAFEPTVAFFTPLQCESLVRARRRPRPYRLAVCGGDCIAPESARRFEALHGALTISYGSTELGSVSVTGARAADEARWNGEMQPLPGVELRIEPFADADEYRERGGGVLCLRGPHAFDGYVDRHGAPLLHASLLPDRWFRTGDVATVSSGGLRVLGRYDLSINRNGLLLPLADVESRARELGAIGEAVAVAGGTTLRGRELVLFCTLVPGRAENETDLRAACVGQLPEYAVPDRVKIVSDLPRLASGKPDRRALAALL
jgi:acyl-CoA synthetase (AMP-forming)/AMP-acid ligase II